VAKESQSFAKVHEDLDLDIAQAHIEATIDAYCDDKAAFKRAMATTEGVDAGAVANIILAFFGRL
jgi:hypothetical protein